jgi:hypothetical protein
MTVAHDFAHNTSVRRSWLTYLATVLAVVTLRAQASPALPEVLAKLNAYLKAYGQQYSASIATEHYTQISGFTNDPLHKETILDSDFGIVHVPGDAQWLGFRDVYRVDGKAVQDRNDRLARLFSDASGLSMTQATRIVADGARFNIGTVRRNINNPALVFRLLDPFNEFRLRFSKLDEETQGGVRLWVIRFFEQYTPTLVRTSQGDDEPAEGRIWVDPASGCLHRADITIRSTAPAMRSFRASLSVIFQEDARLRLWVPAKMTERYEASDIDYMAGEATYADYRQFGVKTDEQFLAR